MNASRAEPAPRALPALHAFLILVALALLVPYATYLTDDSYIHFQFAKHILRGEGFALLKHGGRAPIIMSCSCAGEAMFMFGASTLCWGPRLPQKFPLPGRPSEAFAGFFGEILAAPALITVLGSSNTTPGRLHGALQQACRCGV